MGLSASEAVTLCCKELNKSFGGIRALQNVAVCFPSSGVVSIIGPNGAGKSTLFNVLTGVLKPDSGGVFLNDYEITSLPSYKIAQLGIARTFQSLRLIAQVSTLDNLLLACRSPRGEKLWRAMFRIGVKSEEQQNREIAQTLLETIGLKEYAKSLTGSLSYGQQKLLSIACGLATDSKILLLDEPVAGVYPETAKKILEMLRQLGANGKLIVFIEHDISAVRRIADTLIVMDEGKIIAQGAPGEVLDRPEIMEAYLA